MGTAISIHDIDGLHKEIGNIIAKSVRDLSGNEIRFLRNEMLMSQNTLARLLGVSEQAIRRWENGKIDIPKPIDSLLRLLYLEHVNNRNSKIAAMLKEIANLEDDVNHQELHFKETSKGWQNAD